MSQNSDYTINQVGAKILLKSTQSFVVYIEESGRLEFFLIYILLAEHSDKDYFKSELAKHYKKEKNIASEKLVEYLNSEESDEIFSAKTYELYFGQMAYTRLTDNALSYFKDVLAEVVREKPSILKSNEKEQLDYIMSFDTMEELVKDIAERKIQKLFYGGIADIKNFFKTRLGIDLFDSKENEKKFLQLIKQRNLIVHNRGIITQELVDEFPIYQELIGQRLHYKYEQLSNINKIIGNIIVDIDLKLRHKFNLKTISIEQQA